MFLFQYPCCNNGNPLFASGLATSRVTANLQGFYPLSKAAVSADGAWFKSDDYH